MQQLGWHFHVISPAFAVHRGFPSKKERPKFIINQTIANGKLVAKFKDEVAAKAGKLKSKQDQKNNNK